ncbi:hypothetical protein HMSSN036_03470 [Paenibacillus macerans]|nr:hypothetical protein HMSSN036_03470 [Paenibacillus macerans]
MGSLEAKIQQMQTAWENLALTMGNSNQLKTIIDMGTSLVHVLTKLVENFGLLNFATLSALTAMFRFTSAGKTVVTTVSSMSPLLNRFNNYVDRLSAMATRASRSTRLMGVNLNMLKLASLAASAAAVGLQTVLSLGLSLAITAVVSGLTYLYNKFQEQKKDSRRIGKTKIKS